MFTSLQNILSTQPRHAEQADTRQEIRRHDPDAERRHKGHAEEDDQDFLMEDDHAVVSVMALKVFLQNFLKSQAVEKIDQGKTEEKDLSAEEAVAISQDVHQRMVDTQKPADVQASAAVRAYQHTAEATQGPRFDQQSAENSQNLLGGEDIRVIHGLLADLEGLLEAQVEYLKIEKAETFLKSLEAGVAAAKRV